MDKPGFTIFVDEFIQALKIRNLSALTIIQTQRRIKKFIDYLNKFSITHIDGITKEIISSYQIFLYETINSNGVPNSVRHQNHMMAAVKQFLRFLYEKDYLIFDPSKAIVYGKEPKQLPRSIFSAPEARKILHAPDVKTILGYRDRTILEILYSSGIRKNELNNLRISQVDYADGFLQIIEGKGKKDRVVPIGKIACRYLENYITCIRPEFSKDPHNPYLFLSSKGRKLSKNVVFELVKKYAKEAKIKKNVSPHTFRHSCATAMLKNKANIRAVQELLGHESLNSTQVYTHINITELKDIHHQCHPREKDKE